MAAPMLKVKKTNKIRSSSPAASNTKKKKLSEGDEIEICSQLDPVTMDTEESQDVPVTVVTELANQYVFKDSSFVARYTDPQTKLRYATTEEYSRIRMMPSDLVTGCLALRKANIPV